MEYRNYENLRYMNAIPTYLENPVLKPRPFYHTDFEDSLERIVLREEPEEEKDLTERLFSDKSRTLRATIKALFNEITLRERLNSFLLYQINEDICRQHNHLEQVRQLTRFNYSTDFLNYFSKAKMKLEDNVLGLEKEKRHEYLECWKDLMHLKRYMMSALSDYWKNAREMEFLNGEYQQEDEDVF